MSTGFTWSAFLTHVAVAVLGYISGLFTPPPGSSK